MRYSLIIFILGFLISCGKNGADGQNGLDGATTFGINGTSTGVDFEDLEPGLVCANGGISVFTFKDLNSDGIPQPDEDVIRVKAICNGLNGTNGVNGTSSSTTLEVVVSSSTCPQGGVKISSTGSAAVEVCHGVNGVNGVNGSNGTNGLNGTNGSLISPVKFCATDSSTFPEYGLLIDGELFAVYWGVTPGSPSAPQAFLTKLVAGNYQSTGGNNCLFSVSN